MIKSLQNLTVGIVILLYLRCHVHCQNNARSYDTNDWIPVAQPYQNGNPNFPQLHAVHGKQVKPSEAGRQFNDLQQQTNLPNKEQRLNVAQQVRLSPPTLDSPKSPSQGLPFIHQNTPFLSQVSFQEPKSQVADPPNQESVIAQNIQPPVINHQIQAQSQEPREEIQLLYVPLETLRQREQRQQFQTDHAVAQSQVRFVDQQNLTPQAHKQVQLQNIEQDFIQQALQAHKLQQQFQQQNFVPQSYNAQFQQPEQQQFIQEASTTKAPAIPKKRKPHQPPLAVYMESEGHTANDVTVADVLALLKDAKSITVQDYVSEDSPKVFVGPSNLQSPDGYVKFSLPYLSSLDKHKKEGIDKLPFFVAPLNYKTPAGYSKIPFPSPHVGSVVINQRRSETTEKEKSQQNLASDQYLNDNNNQLLYNEASTVPSNNKNRQAFSTVFPLPSHSEATAVTSEIPYGPIPINQQYYSTHKTIGAHSHVSTTTPRAYSQHQHDSPIYSDQFSTGHRYTTPTPSSTELFTPAPQVYSVTTNRNPSRTSHIHQRPQVNLSTPDSYYDTIKNKSPNRYLPEINQQVSSTTSKQYTEEHVSPNQEFVTQHRFADNYKTQKNQNFAQRTPSHIRFEPVTNTNFSINQQTNDQTYRLSYQTANVPNDYNTKIEDTESKEADKPKVVTESSFVSTQSVQDQHYVQNEQYRLPNINPIYQAVEHEMQHPVNKPGRYQQAPELQDINHRFVFRPQINQYEQPTFVNTERQKVLEYTTPRHQEPVKKQHYKLPADLPISPQLPSLVNSLEDQAIRPLLAPLLNLPSAEEAQQSYFSYTEAPKINTEKPKVYSEEPKVYSEIPKLQEENPELYSEVPKVHSEAPKLHSESPQIYNDVSSIYSVTPKVQTESHVAYSDSPRILSSTIPSAPVISNTEHIVLGSVTPGPTVETTPYKRLRGRHRGTRPTNSPSTRPRTTSHYRGRRPYQDLHKDSLENSRSTTERTTFTRNRYSSRERQPTTSTEYTRDINRDHQKRFRTRGRPLKIEEDSVAYSERGVSSTESIVLTQPSKQYSPQIIKEEVNVTPGSIQSSTEEERKTYINSLQNDQPLSYLINGQHIVSQNIQRAEIDPQIYVLREETPISEEVKQHVPAKEMQPVVQEPIIQEITRVQPSVDHSQYLVETSKPRIRSRTRDRSRSKTQTKSSTTTPATTTSTEESNEQGGSQEFYGFFRAPTFKPLKMEYKQSSDIRATALPVQQSTFAPQYTDETHTFFINDVRSSTPRVYQIQTEEAVFDENKNQYVSRVSSIAPDNSYEDIKPITIRTTPARRRFSTTQQIIINEGTTTVPDRYTTRPKIRPDSQTQRVTRIRGRLRRPVTPSSETQTSSEENYSVRPQDRESSPNKLRSRGKAHFKLRESERIEDEDISENYPPNFLRAQASTLRPSFRLTIEPEDSVEEQEGAYSSHPRLKQKEIVKGEESQRYEKTIEGPNQIISNDKKENSNDKLAEEINITETIALTSPVNAKLVGNSMENTSTENKNDETEEIPQTTEISTESEMDVDFTIQEATTLPVDTTMAISTTTTEQSQTVSTENMKKKGRRGTWKLVAHRPVDMFQSAESQNIGTVFVNDIQNEGKEYKKDKLKIEQMLADEAILETEEDFKSSMKDDSNVDDYDTFTTENAVITTMSEDIRYINNEALLNEKQSEMKNNKMQKTDEEETTEQESIDSKTTEISFLEQLMSNIEKQFSGEKSEEISTDKMETEQIKKNLTESNDDFWKHKIIGTSTTTEISHETEICYKGRCIKSLM